MASLERPTDLPDYSEPPIDEVAIGLQFAKLVGFTDVHAGLFWQRVRSRGPEDGTSYTRTQSRPRADAPVESFDESASLGVPLPGEFVRLDPNDSRGNRTWLVSEDDTELLQIQDTQFIRNWRRRAKPYEHLDSYVVEFWRDLDAFVALLADEHIDTPVLEQLELTYFNWIPDERAWLYLRAAEASSSSTLAVHPAPREMVLVMSYLDANPDGTPVARLRTEWTPGARLVDGLPIRGYRFVLSYRVPVDNPSRDELLELIARGRNVIVRTFTDLTTTAAHDSWGRTT